jgi:hypothetical protein
MDLPPGVTPATFLLLAAPSLRSPNRRLSPAPRPMRHLRQTGPRSPHRLTTTHEGGAALEKQQVFVVFRTFPTDCGL